MKLLGNMARFLILYGLLLVASFSRSAPILDEEVDNDFGDNDDEIQDEERMNEDNDDDYKSINARDDDYDDEGPDLKRKDEDDYSEDKEVDVSEQGDPQELNDDDDDDDESEESEEQIINAAGKNVVEDSQGKMALEKITDIAGDDEEEGGEEEMDEPNVEDMDKKLSEIKKIFNDYMPKELQGLKSSSEALKNDLDHLNAKLDNFLRENGIKQDPAVPKSDGENDYVY